MERQEGYYWVNKQGYFYIALYVINYLKSTWWCLPGENNTYEDSDFDHINENRIKQPGEL